MKIPSGKPRSTRKLSRDEQAAERLKRTKPVDIDRALEYEEPGMRIHHIASSRAHRGRSHNPYVP